jgi:hypothetical protein
MILDIIIVWKVVTTDLVYDVEQSDTSYLISKLENSKNEIIESAPTGTIANIQIKLLKIHSIRLFIYSN